MQKKYIAPAIMLIAGAITSIINILNKVVFIDFLKILLLVLILFYILGSIVTVIIIKVTSIDKRIEKEEIKPIVDNEKLEEPLQPTENNEASTDL